MKPMLTEETHALVVKVMESNPGALRVIHDLCRRSKWFEIMHYCIRWGITGELFWELYETGFNFDINAMADFLEQRMLEERRYSGMNMYMEWRV